MNDLLTPADFVDVGYIGGLYGYEGLLKASFDERKADMAHLPVDFLYFLVDDMFVPRFISTCNPDQALIGFERYSSREAARELTDQVVYLRKRDLTPVRTAEDRTDSYDIFLLQDFQIWDVNSNTLVGTIIRIEEYPGGWMAETLPANEGEEILIPLAIPLIHKIESDQNRVYMDLPDGLLEL